MLIHASSSEERRRRDWRRNLIRTAVVTAAAVLSVGLYVVTLGREGLYEWATTRGYYPDRSETGQLRTELPVAARQWANSVVSPAELPLLTVDIKFRHLSRLRDQRAQAIATGVLVQGDDDYVPATIRLPDRAVRVELRLKGDLVAGQFSTDTWSFRVGTKGDDHVFGMRRFSLHHPDARAYHTEPLFLEHVRSVGILAPRYRFVRLSINGDDQGIMALEEHFSKELLESQGRKESVIVRIDEGRYWSRMASDERHASAFSDFRTADFTPFRAGKVAGSATLTRDLAAATGLYRGFVEGRIAPSTAFDADLMGRYLAVVDAWNAWHAASWRNIRFYYNPTTARLEPVAYDAEVILVGDHPPELLHVLLLEDPAIREAYEETLAILGEPGSPLIPLEQLRASQDMLLRQLHRSFPFLTAVDLDELADRARARAALDPVERAHIDPQAHLDVASADAARSTFEGIGPEVLARVRVLPDGVGRKLELASVVDAELTARVPGRTEPVTLRGTPLGQVPTPVYVALADSTGLDSVYVEHEGRGAWVVPLPYFPALDASPVPEASLTAIAAHDFLSYDEERRVVSVDRGQWKIEGTVSLPDGVGLFLPGGTQLAFDADALLIVRGPTVFAGTESSPIVLHGATDDGWGGMIVYNGGTSADWSNVHVHGTTGIRREHWGVTGSVTLVGGTVSIADSRFKGNRAEDALNLVHTSFTLENVAVEDAASDGIDIDFGSGEIVGGRFAEIGWLGGGDAIDFSGATVSVRGTEFYRVGDKAISVGERSVSRVSGIRVQDANVALASKDGSYVEVAGSRLRGIQWAAVMAYTKKPEFGGAVLEVRGPLDADGPRASVAQLGSVLRIDGALIQARSVDVDSLYATIMRPGMQR